jgi:uncharacterized repeat protein (TIGR03803 family)
MRPTLHGLIVFALVMGSTSWLSAGYVTSAVVLFQGSNGAMPYGTLISDNTGNLYGTTYRGGTANVGTVFEIPAGTHTATVLAGRETGT